MSFYILDSRNNGYPCIYELQDIPDTDMKYRILTVFLCVWVNIMTVTPLYLK